jgi:uncharacterized protein (TIGR02246 family)
MTNQASLRMTDRVDMNMVRTTLLAVGVIALVGCDGTASTNQRAETASGPAPDSTTMAVETAIAGVWADHLAAAKRGDPVGVSAMYATDAVYAVGGAPEVRGRPAIDSFEARGLRAATVLDGVRHTTQSVHRAGDVAYELGTIVGPVQPAGDTARVVTFNFMAQWRREPDGAWRLLYLVGR